MKKVAMCDCLFCLTSIGYVVERSDEDKRLKFRVSYLFVYVGCFVRRCSARVESGRARTAERR